MTVMSELGLDNLSRDHDSASEKCPRRQIQPPLTSSHLELPSFSSSTSIAHSSHTGTTSAMGFFDDLVAFVLPTAYADNQAQPVEESNKAYGEPHDSDPSEGDAMKQDETVENKSIQSTPKETDAGEDKGDDEEKEGGEEQSSGGDDAEEEEEGGEAEEEEEEEEEPVDVLPKLLEGKLYSLHLIDAQMQAWCSACFRHTIHEAFALVKVA